MIYPQPLSFNLAAGTLNRELTDRLKSAARELGFTLAGACPAVTPAGASKLGEWLDRGYAGEMEYLAARQAAYEHPRHVLEGARSILMLGMPYFSEEPAAIAPGQGRATRLLLGARRSNRQRRP